MSVSSAVDVGLTVDAEEDACLRVAVEGAMCDRGGTRAEIEDRVGCMLVRDLDALTVVLKGELAGFSSEERRVTTVDRATRG